MRNPTIDVEVEESPQTGDVIDPLAELPEGEGPRSRDESLERFLDVFERSARRWEMIVYPILFAFILLAGYGFYLVYSLTNDMKNIAAAIDPQMGLHMTDFTSHLDEISHSVDTLTTRVSSMSDDISTIATRMDHLGHMPTMVQEMAGLNRSVASMSQNINAMSWDLGQLNHNISKPMSKMNKFLPW